MILINLFKLMNTVAICENYELIQRKIIDQIKQYDNDGYWSENKIQNIPLQDIEYDIWNQDRYDKNLALISQKHNVMPIDSFFDKKIGKYTLNDGNHRCGVCVNLGYTHIPAVIAVERYDKPHVEYYDNCIKILRIETKIFEYKTRSKRDEFDLHFEKIDHIECKFYIDNYKDSTIILAQLSNLQQVLQDEYNYPRDWIITEDNTEYGLVITVSIS